MLKLFAYILLLTPAFAQYDLLLKGGHVIDPKNGIDRQMDIAIVAGKIAAVAPAIDASQAKNLIDVHGLYVTPGLVDIHTHLFYATNLPAAWAGDAQAQTQRVKTIGASRLDPGVISFSRCLAPVSSPSVYPMTRPPITRISSPVM